MGTSEALTDKYGLLGIENNRFMVIYALLWQCTFTIRWIDWTEGEVFSPFLGSEHLAESTTLFTYHFLA